MIGFIIFLLVLGGYAFIGGVAYYILLRQAQDRCRRCQRHGVDAYEYSDCEHNVFAGIVAVCWPVGLPMALGINAARKWMDS